MKENNNRSCGKGELVFNILLEAGYVLAIFLFATALYLSIS